MSAQTASRINFVRSSQVDSKTYQQCLKCKEVKEINQFHHRGVGYQRICKSCRKAHIPSGAKRIIFLNPPELYAPLLSRIEALEAKLRAMSRRFSNGDNLEADDIYAAMVDEILFKSKPTDSDSRILTRAKWAAKAIIRKTLAYSAMVGDESEMTSKDEDGDIDVDIRVSFSRSAEEELTEKERAAEIKSLIDQLAPEYRQIVLMLSLGHNQREISIKLNISEQAVSHKIKRVAVEFGNLGFSY
jgi:DNA-binding NarL/FixJ family response regulator